MYSTSFKEIREKSIQGNLFVRMLEGKTIQSVTKTKVYQQVTGDKKTGSTVVFEIRFTIALLGFHSQPLARNMLV